MCSIMCHTDYTTSTTSSTVMFISKKNIQDFGTVVKNTPANAEGTGSIPGPGRSHVP